MSDEARARDAAVLRIVHHHPGRLRLRSRALIEREDLLGAAREALRRVLPGACVVPCAETGSLVVDYEPCETAPDAAARAAAAAAGLELDPEVACRPERTHAERFVSACHALHDTAYELTGYRVEPRTLAPAALAAVSMALLAVGRGSRLPRWDNLAFWSLSLFVMLHDRDIRAARPGLGKAPSAPPSPTPSSSSAPSPAPSREGESEAPR
ncbi:MAG: hypothetical protein R3B70_09895 [Polyangiaceae bacterium]